MPQVITEDHKGFTKRVSKNDIAPKDGSPPLTIIQFSLTNEVRDSLKAALDKPIRDGNQNDGILLAEMIEEYMPKELMAEMQELAQNTDDPHHVYVMKL